MCEEKESLSHLSSTVNPPLKYNNGEIEGRRKIRRHNIFHEGSGAYIVRLVISPLLCDVTEVEKTIHKVT